MLQKPKTITLTNYYVSWGVNVIILGPFWTHFGGHFGVILDIVLWSQNFPKNDVQPLQNYLSDQTIHIQISWCLISPSVHRHSLWCPQSCRSHFSRTRQMMANVCQLFSWPDFHANTFLQFCSQIQMVVARSHTSFC